MSATRRERVERIEELALDRALVGLSADESRELESLLEGDDEALAEAEWLAALGHESLIDAEALEPMPAVLAGRIAMHAPFAMPRPRRPFAGEADDRGWRPSLVAAAAILLLIGGLALRDRAARPTAEPDLATRLARLESKAPDLVSAEWRTVREGFPGVTGRVLWSSARQEGMMVLEGLPRNDPRRSQYQLWIVDPSRDQEPVDGGVFDVAGGGRVIVPIRAKLEVRDPRAFVITEEQPGGVVVSEGPHLVLAAPPGR